MSETMTREDPSEMKKEGIQEDGELPEEGEITDDEDEQKLQVIDNLKRPQITTPNCPNLRSNSRSPPASIQQKQQNFRPNFDKPSGREFRPNGGGSFRKSFGGESFSGNRGGSGKFTPKTDMRTRYRDFDDRIATKNAQQEEEMIDSWVRGAHRKGRPNSPSRDGGISPIRTSPLVDANGESSTPNCQDEKIAAQHNRHSPPPSFVKKDIDEFVVPSTKTATGPIDDDRDFRMASASIQPENTNDEQQRTDNVGGFATSTDDNDFRHSSATESQQHLEPFSHPHILPQEEQGHEENRRRPHSQSPPKGAFDGNHQEFESTPKRYRPDNMGGFTPPDREFEGQQHQFHGEPWQPGGFRPFQQNHRGDHHGGSGGRTQGWGYRGGRPFFPRLICKFFREGFCRDAEKCTFSHATVDSHRQPALCKFYQQGFCKKSLFCQLMHGEWPCKAFHKGECTKEQCTFSHQPLDDVSRPIVEKMLEDDRLGIVGPEQQQQQRTPQQMGQPMFRNRFQHHHNPNFRPHQQYQQHQPFHRTPQQFHPQMPPPSQFQQPQQQQQHPPPPHHSHESSFNVEAFPDGHQGIGNLEQRNMISDRSGQMQMQNPSDVFIDAQQHQQSVLVPAPNIPPPTLVIPAMLGTSNAPQMIPSSGANPTSTQGNPTFGFFNPVASSQNQQPNAGPSPFYPSQQTASLPETPPNQPSFQQLQQQVRQGPHFPHQPSLLGPPTQGQSPSFSTMNGQQQQEITEASFMPEGTSPEKQVEKKPDDSSVSTSTAGDGGGFNINQMLEQITRQQPSPKPSLSPSQSGPTIDLFASIGLCSNEIPEESPESPAAISGEQQPDGKPAALIPMIREWKLYPVDIPQVEDPIVQFDIKFVQQISSSNSDPRLRKLAEKQFDLVSKTLEQQQQQENQLKTYNTNEGNGQKVIKEEGIEKVASGSGSRKLVTDPRKDPRMKTTEGKETRADAVGRGRTTSRKGNNFGSQAKIESPTTKTNLTMTMDPMRTALNEEHCERDTNAMGQHQMASFMPNIQQQPPPSTSVIFSSQPQSQQIQQQQQIHMQIPPFHALQPHQLPTTSSSLPNLSAPPPQQQPFSNAPMPMPTGQPQQHIPPAQQMPGPYFIAHQPPPPPFMVPPNQHPPPYFHPLQQTTPLGPNAPPPSSAIPHQQLGAHAFSMASLGGGGPIAGQTIGESGPLGGGGGPYREIRGGGEGRHQPQQQPGSPKHHQQQHQGGSSASQAMISLRDKRRNNEYESPLARSSGNR